MKEIWKDVYGYEGLYRISTFGKIKSLNKRSKTDILKISYSKFGYGRVTLYKNAATKRFLVHRLAAFQFLLNTENKPEVNHKDGNPKNNKLSNLEWATRSENTLHAFRFLGKKNTSSGMTGYKSYSGKEICVEINGNKKEFGSILDASKKLNISRSSLRYRVNYPTKKSKYSYIKIVYIIDKRTLK